MKEKPAMAGKSPSFLSPHVGAERKDTWSDVQGCWEGTRGAQELPKAWKPGGLRSAERQKRAPPREEGYLAEKRGQGHRKGQWLFNHTHAHNHTTSTPHSPSAWFSGSKPTHNGASLAKEEQLSPHQTRGVRCRHGAWIRHLPRP